MTQQLPPPSSTPQTTVPVPTFILRGHLSPIHALHFFRDHALLASGDADGWVVVWSLATKRAVAAWRAHVGSILGVRDWCTVGGDGDRGEMRIVTHGRDHRLCVWQLKSQEGEGGLGGGLELDFGLDARLPVDRGDDAADTGTETDTKRVQPWLLHAMAVNALNFCAFAMCYDDADLRLDGSLSTSTEVQDSVSNGRLSHEVGGSLLPQLPEAAAVQTVIIAVSNALNSGAVDFFHLPSERRVSTLPVDKDVETGMVMALSLSRHPANGHLVVVSGYESGHAMVHIRQSNSADQPWSWKKVLVSQPHSQPLLSLDVSPTGDFFFTSSADAIIAKIAVPTNATASEVTEKPTKILNTKHAGQQGLTVRSDGKIFATAGWDARIRVYSAKAMRELAVLKWHKDGCYAIAFATIDHAKGREEGPSTGLAGRDLPHDPPRSALDAIKHQRNTKAQSTHWLAGGGKDGKISLWDIY